MLQKLMEILLEVFIIGRIFNFIYAQFWNFHIRGSGVISGLKNIDYFRNFANFSPKSKVKISKISPNYS
jgi:hypothetical protein